MLNEDRCGCHWSGVVCPVNLKRKAGLKFFLIAEFMCCEGQNFREIKI